jgi:hypothetical protein
LLLLGRILEILEYEDIAKNNMKGDNNAVDSNSDSFGCRWVDFVGD